MNKKEKRFFAERNLKLMYIMRTLGKRVYLPITAIYLNSVVGMSLGDIGVLLGFMGVVRLLVEVPSGYISDRVSRRLCLVLMGLFCMIGMVVLIAVQSKAGAYIGILFETIGYAFWSGTNSAIVHDSLDVLKRSATFTKYMNKLQSISLIANAVLIVAVTASYAIDVRLPFLFGFLQFALMTVCAYLCRDVIDLKTFKQTTAKVERRKRAWLKKHQSFLLFAVFAGLSNAFYTAPSSFKNIALEAFGVPVASLGLVFSMVSIFAAIFGLVAHKLADLKLTYYLLIDGFIVATGYGILVTGNPIIAILAFMVSMGFWRYRGFYYQQKILEKYKDGNKATMISIVVNAEEFHGVWLPIVIGVLMAAYGLQTGFLLIGIVIAALFIPFIIVARSELSK